MAQFRDIIRRLDKHKDLEMNLPSFVNEMMDMFFNRAIVRFSMGYYNLKENINDGLIISEEDKEAFANVEKIVSAILDSTDIDREACFGELANTRTRLVDSMETLTAYTDRFKLHEYMLNRVEGRFSEDFDEEYYYKQFKKDILKYVFADKNESNQRLNEVISELPIRITKSRFYENIMGAFSLYRDSDKAAFDEFVYMLRSAATLYVPNGFTDSYKELGEILDKVEAYDYKDISKEDYEEARNCLTLATDKLNSESDNIYELIELYNECIVILLCSQYANRIDDGVKKLATTMVGVIRKEKTMNDFVDSFVGIEGLIESITEYVGAGEHILDDYIHDDILDSLVLRPQFNDLIICNRLGKGSNFVSLDVKESENIDDSYISTAFEKLVNEFEECFATKPAMYRRALMSAVMGYLPHHFSNLDEVEEYIDTALSSCRDEAERKACVEVIGSMMNAV